MKKLSLIRKYWWTIMPVVFLIYKFGIQPHYDTGLRDNGRNSIAVITGVRLKSISFEFDVNGVTYSSTSGRSGIPSVMCNYLRRGEKFEIRFDSINPYNNELYLSKPIIDSTFVLTNGFNIKSVSKRIVEFQYVAKQRKYSRYQIVNQETFKIKETHKVFYLDHQPEVAYIVD